MATTFTLANLTDLASGAGITVSGASASQSSPVAASYLVTTAGAITFTLTPSIWTAGNRFTVIDAASYPQRASSPITINVAGGGTINGFANYKIEVAGGCVELAFTGGLAFQVTSRYP